MAVAITKINILNSHLWDVPSSPFYRLIKPDTDNMDCADREGQTTAFPFTAHGCSLGPAFISSVW